MRSVFGKLRRFWPVAFLLFWPVLASGQNLSGVSICLDPGHGPGNQNQGPTGLHEYVINMKVTRMAWRYLLSAGADTVILTRQEGDPDISLYQRDQIANNAGVDWFHSIHHNAFNGSSRYTMVLYQEIIGENRPRWPEAYDMCMIMAPEIYRGLRTSAWYVRSDYDIRGFNFGVLKYLTMPGELSEGTFHDHPVEERKLRNPQFLEFEAIAIYHSFLKYFDAGSMPFAPLGGIVYDSDSHQPVDSARVHLLPVDTVYTTDGNHNGFYGFPKLVPGEYVLRVEAEGYLTQSDTIQIQADRFNFRDFYLVSTVPPGVTQSFPDSGQQDVSPYGFIGIVFNRPMNVPSVKHALHVEPEFPYVLQWLDNNTKLKIDPLTILEFGRSYRVVIDSSARDIYDRQLDGNGDGQGGDPFVLEFRTRGLDPARPEILATDPIDYATGIFPGDVVQVRVSKPLDVATLTKDNLILRGGSRRALDIFVHQAVVPPGHAVLSILPQNFYSYSQTYVLNLTSNLKDSLGNRITQSYIFRYTTGNWGLNLSLVNAFEDSAARWGDPATSPRSSGIDANAVRFTLASGESLRAGRPVAELRYSFLADGIVDVPFLVPPDTLQHIRSGEIVGVYVLGDSSLTRLRFYFADSSDGLEAGPWTTVDWQGWKLVRFTAGEDSLFAYEGGNGRMDGPLSLAGFQLAGDAGQSGTLFVSDWLYASQPQVRVVQTGKAEAPPKEHVLVQSFPNPFSRKMGQAGVFIAYTIPGSYGPSEVSLAIYNMLGQKVAELVRGVQEPGSHRVFWNVLDEAQQNLPAGVYFYRLQVGSEVQTHRIVILN